MSFQSISALLSEKHRSTLAIVRANAERLLNHTPRFRYFTLHGTNHIDNLFNIFSIILAGGIEMSEQEVYLFSLALCIHDLGMVCQLSSKDREYVLDGQTESSDPANLEDYIRETHHELIDRYVEEHADFLTAAGLTPAEIGHLVDISKSHRKIVLAHQSGFIRYLGALLRIVDELDIGGVAGACGCTTRKFPRDGCHVLLALVQTQHRRAVED
jgi:hypothetical protein